jgi:hypothetical protein
MSANSTVHLESETIIVSSHLIFYGSRATEELGNIVVAEIDRMYNNANGKILFESIPFTVAFKTTFEVVSEYDATVLALNNRSSMNNFIRIEDSNVTTRSFMNLRGNSGHWLTTDKLGFSTTAPHEIGHGLCLEHTETDQRGFGPPDIMAARGTLVDPQYQYDPKVPAGLKVKGGTVNPIYRVVKQRNIDQMFAGVTFNNYEANIGEPFNLIYDAIGRRISLPPMWA